MSQYNLQRGVEYGMLERTYSYVGRKIMEANGGVSMRGPWAHRFGVVILGLGLTAGSALGAAASDEIEARLTRIEGSVFVRPSAAESDGFIAADLETPVQKGDLIRTGKDGSADLSLDGQSVIEISPNTDFSVDSLVPAKSRFSLGIGSFLAKIKSLVSGERMEFRTPEAVASVRGTELGISKEADDRPALVGVFEEGRVEVRRPGSFRKVEVGPGQETEVRRGEPLERARPMRALLQEKNRFEGLRQRREQIRRTWATRSKQQRAAARSRFLKMPRVKAGNLRNVREEMRKRVYSPPRPKRRENGNRRGSRTRSHGGKRR